jgi:hypothetical protein
MTNISQNGDCSLRVLEIFSNIRNTHEDDVYDINKDCDDSFHWRPTGQFQPMRFFYWSGSRPNKLKIYELSFCVGCMKYFLFLYEDIINYF